MGVGTLGTGLMARKMEYQFTSHPEEYAKLGSGMKGKEAGKNYIDVHTVSAGYNNDNDYEHH